MKILRPSGSLIWSKCTGSHFMQDGLPDDESDAAREGTAAHWLGGDKILKSYVTPGAEILVPGEFLDQLAPNDVLIDQEMIQGVTDYVTDVLGYLNKTGLMQSTHVEESVNLDHIYPGMSGTPDCWIHNTNDAEIVIYDFKYGHGHVEVFENTQLMIYASGILNQLGINGSNDHLITVRLRIFQPRSYHSSGPMREWVINGSDLRGYINQIKAKANEAMSGNGSCNTGNHCKHCTARFNCEALTKTVYNSIDVITGINRLDLNGNNLGLELKLLNRISKLIEFRRDAIESQVKAVLESGEMIPGFIPVDTFSRLKWKKDTPVEQVLMMADLMGVDIRKPDNLDTPTQALAKIKKKAKESDVKLDDNIIKSYTEKTFTGVKIIEDDGSYLRQAFTKDI
jgi:hypothetical protein